MIPNSPYSCHLPEFCAILLISVSTLSTAVSAQRMRIGSSSPTGYAAGTAYSDAFFAAGDTLKGVELWHYTGTTTYRRADLYPGPLSSYPTEITRRSPSNGNTWLVARTLSATSGQLGRELHYYPNLPSGTVGGFIKDVRPGSASSNSSELTVVGSRLFFVANDGTSGRELWTSDGTPGGTVRVKDIVPGSTGSNPFGLIAFGNKLYFAATTKVNGTELWSSDGSASGTSQVLDIRTGSRSSTPTHFEVFGRQLFFAATTKSHGRELWSTRGTAATTALFLDLEVGALSSSPTQMTAGSTLAFTASTANFGRELYVLNGAAAVRKSNLARGESIGAITAVGSQFWFRAKTTLLGHELWRTTSTGIQLVHDLQAGPGGSFPANIRAVGSQVLFRADDGSKGMEYWRTNGSTATILKDIRPLSCSSRPSKLTPVTLSTRRQVLLFSAKGDDNGIEFWRTDGLTANLVQNIDPLQPLPGLHFHEDAGGVNFVIDLKDADSGGFAWFAIGTSVGRPIRFLRARGLLAINLLTPTLVVGPLQISGRGHVTLRFQKPPIRSITSLVCQAFASTSAGGLEITSASTCNIGVKDIDPPNGGPRVEGEVCLDDESGEYTIRAKRLDNATVDAFIGLYQKGPGGDLELLQSYPLGIGEEINDSGQIEILMPLDFFDEPGRHLEIHLFKEEPTPEGANTGSLVVQSYC